MEMTRWEPQSSNSKHATDYDIQSLNQQMDTTENKTDTDNCCNKYILGFCKYRKLVICFQGAPSFPTLIFHDFSMTKLESCTRR